MTARDVTAPAGSRTERAAADGTQDPAPSGPTGPRRPTDPRSEAGTERRVRWSLAVGGVLAVAGVLLGLAGTGAATPLALLDPGVLVRWGLPVVTVLVHGAATLTVGALALCAAVLPPGAAWQRAATAAGVAAVSWTLLQTVELVLTHASVAGGAGADLAQLVAFATQVELGTTLSWAVVLTAVVAVAAVTVAPGATAGWACVLALVALVPTALTGHAAAASDHGLAVSAMWMHVVGVALWVGALAVLVLVAPRTGPHLPVVAARYSRVAGWSIVLVAVSGAANTWIRLNGPTELFTTSWGLLLLGKLVLVAALAAAGARHRRTTLPRLVAPAAGGRGTRRPFWRLAGGEVALMGTVIGVSVALGSSPPPVPVGATGGAEAVEQLTGYPAPPPPGVLSYLTQWQPELIFVTAAAAGAVVYLLWVRRLRRRGDAWPLWRAAAWLAGLAFFAWVTSGGPGVYGRVLFSAHMVQHMALIMLIPILVVLAAPVSLALRALPRRRDGSRGPREWLLALVGSRWSQFFAHPVVAALNVVVSMAVFYLTPLFEVALRYHPAHILMIVHFTVVGYLFVNVLIGVDPGPRRPPYPLRLVLLLPSMVFHTFFGLGVMSSTTLLAASYFTRLELPWRSDLLADQQVGAAFTWAMGELPALALAGLVAMRWVAADERAERRAECRAAGAGARGGERAGHHAGRSP